MKFWLEKIDNSVLNWHGYRIVGEDGRVMLPIRTKAEGERLIRFFTEVKDVTEESKAQA